MQNENAMPSKLKRKRKNLLSPNQEAFLCYQYITGSTIQQLAKEWDIAVGTVFNILQRNGVKAKNYKK